MARQPRQDGGEVGVVEGGGEAFGGDAPLAGGVLTEQIEREMADDGEIARGMAGAHAAGVLAEGDIESQWTRFSIPQWLRTAAAQSRALSGALSR